ncbi:MAG: hypothetical protein IKU49_05345 [Prevotella sp.]|nr:hypothetical protein [Prevotella sp.]
MKTAVFYYTQSGQALDVAKSLCSGMQGEVVFKEIIPQQVYPFPWDRDAFFDVFPETRLGMPPSGIQSIDFSDVEDADLVMVVGQSWFLSPSLPLQSFFIDQQVRDYLKGKDVVFVNACRNMWLMTSRKVKAYLKAAEANLVGQIILQDKAPNLLSVLTIIRWLMYGKKTGTGLLPDAGVSHQDISDASRFGQIIEASWKNKDLSHLQSDLLSAGAIQYKSPILFMEKTGHRMFGFWAKFIRRKGEQGDVRRRFRTNLFYYYLLFVLFLISPFAQLVFYLTYPLHRVGYHKDIDCNL